MRYRPQRFLPSTGMVGISIARLVLPHADGNAPAIYFAFPSGLVIFNISICSASHPSSRAMTEAIRKAKHFFPNNALPPYPEPYDQISRVSGKCEIYFFSNGAHGHLPLSFVPLLMVSQLNASTEQTPLQFPEHQAPCCQHAS